MEPLSRSQCVLLYVMGQMAELEDKGLVKGAYRMTDKGFENYRHLVDSGFSATNEELETASKTIFYKLTETGDGVVKAMKDVPM